MGNDELKNDTLSRLEQLESILFESGRRGETEEDLAKKEILFRLIIREGLPGLGRGDAASAVPDIYEEVKNALEEEQREWEAKQSKEKPEE